MRNTAHIQLNARQQQMLDRISLAGEMRIADLRESFQVTEMTIRRDLEKLEEAGSIKRTFGGAIYVGQDVALKERSVLFMEEKMKIGRRAAALIRPGESVFLDGGTTTLQVARFLPQGMDVTVVTNALNVAAELSAKQIPTMMTGGMLLESTHSLVGPMAAQNLAGMAFDRVFLGATGVDIEHGFSNSNIYETEIKQIAIRQSSDAVIVLDHTKFGAKVLVSFASLSGIHRMITDESPDEALLQACIDNGVQVDIAD
ncbi:DeoR/GlpR family DNA-binding transcription regulator [Paenibacillus sp. KQZ6P-2]|uniref:DeoR/GlpR family DNA-binding transcription regulator n=1 Tax=Paenibacillus mangrovi TaxID=2931978 RepID=A0A9X1WRG4_9BACL|nr:DeoR/GlpR family DNA-binding transcription regulator [Paenibacillus mangrovi]MCJ8013688.1 DeoR/GlpR family DNA-binding transcription regulator [Paenibacillus mangrovi]